MRAASEDFVKALSAGHFVAVKVDAWYNGQLIASDLPVVDGSVAEELDAEVPTRASITVADDSGRLVPRTETDPLAPYGSELHIRKGVVVQGVTEFVSLGWFRIQSADITEEWRLSGEGRLLRGGCQVRVEALDRMAHIQDARFTGPEAPQLAGAKDELVRLCQGLIPIGDLSSVPDKPMPQNMVYEEERITAVRKIASMLDAYVSADADGRLVLTPMEPGTASVYRVSWGSTGSLLRFETDLSRDGVYNAVVAKGEQSDTDQAQVVAVAYDVNPLSPTRWDGPFKRVPRMYSSNFITTQEQAEATAMALLTSLLRGQDRALHVRCVPNPALERGDVIDLGLPQGNIQAVVHDIVHPLTASGEMELTVHVNADTYAELDIYE